MATEAQKRAVSKMRCKLESLRFDFNVENQSDLMALEEFKAIASGFDSKKSALKELIEFYIKFNQQCGLLAKNRLNSLK